jgi:hypothetical protein
MEITEKELCAQVSQYVDAIRYQIDYPSRIDITVSLVRSLAHVRTRRQISGYLMEISYAALEQPKDKLLADIIHGLVHIQNDSNFIEDRAHDGRYHNVNFKVLSQQYHLQSTQNGRDGFGKTWVSLTHPALSIEPPQPPESMTQILKERKKNAANDNSEPKRTNGEAAAQGVTPGTDSSKRAAGHKPPDSHPWKRGVNPRACQEAVSKEESAATSARAGN